MRETNRHLFHSKANRSAAGASVVVFQHIGFQSPDHDVLVEMLPKPVQVAGPGLVPHRLRDRAAVAPFDLELRHMAIAVHRGILLAHLVGEFLRMQPAQQRPELDRTIQHRYTGEKMPIVGLDLHRELSALRLFALGVLPLIQDGQSQR